MNDKHPNLDSIFLGALEIESPEQRAVFLQSSCGDDQPLRDQVEQLLRSHQQAGSFLDRPAPELDATIAPDGPSQPLEKVLHAGLSAAFPADAALVIGNANHSVLKSLGQNMPVHRVVLREDVEQGKEPIVRPKSPEMPDRQSDSRYQLQGEIARGGMGAILKGRDTDLGRDLAIKVLLDEHKSKPEVVQRFVEEAQIGGQLQHPGIAPVYELGQFADKRPFFSMKLVKGETLAKLLANREDATQDRGKFLGIFEQICQTMAYAHSRGVIHRDLKPANIMVGAFGEVQVMDWGLAKVLSAGGVADEKKSFRRQQGQSIIQTLRSVGSDSPARFGTTGSQTQMGSVMGTPAYMPPEQALGEVDNLDERADVFGLGAILCEILTGKAPYVADDGTQVFRMASRGKLGDCFERLHACGADAELVELTKHCLELEANDRPSNAGVLAGRVSGYLESVETKLRESELERATQAARAESEAGRAVAESQRAEAERQRAGAESRSAGRLRVIAASLAAIVLLCGVTAVQFKRFGDQQQLLAQQQIQAAKKQNEDRAAALVDGLLSAEIGRVPAILEQMRAERKWVAPLLATRRTEHTDDVMAQRRLALVVHEPQNDVDVLQQWLLTADVDDFPVVRDVLSEKRDQVVKPLWEIALDQEQASETRYRAAAAIASYDPDNAQWEQLTVFAANQLLEQPVTLLSQWANVWRPVHLRLFKPLTAAYRESAADSQARRDKATFLLATLASDQPRILVDLLLDADKSQFDSILAALQPYREQAIELLESAISEEALQANPAADYVQTASRQANAAVALASLGETRRVWTLLASTPRPDARSFLIHRLGPYGVDPRLVVDRLAAETDVSIRRALILSLGEFPDDKIQPYQVALTDVLLKSYRDDPDPGIHGATRWLLRRWGREADLATIVRELATSAIPAGRRWYLTKDLKPMVVLPPATFAMTNTYDEESRHWRRIDRAFAIGQFKTQLGGPWWHAAQLCNQLSEAEGIPADQWCYQDIPGNTLLDLAPDYLSRTGYRMPTEAEWEYAARAGTITSRYFGESDSLLDRYVWYRGNSSGNDVPLQGQLKPSDFGLYDILGSSREMCVGQVNQLQSAPQGIGLWDVEIKSLIVKHTVSQPQRGSSFNDTAEETHAAHRERLDEVLRGAEHSLRVVRTLPLDMCRNAFGDKHPAVLGAMFSQAILAVARQDDAEAAVLDQQLMEQVAAAAGKDEELWQTGLRLSARLAARRGQTEEARRRCDELLAKSPHDLSLAELRLDLSEEKKGKTPWETLAQAYLAAGHAARLDELLDSADRAGKAGIITLSAQQAGGLEELAKSRPDDVSFQLELARVLTTRGELALVAEKPAQALPLFEQAQAIFERFPAPQWTVLRPVEMKSTGGEQLTLESDGSIFVSGPNPRRAVYTLTLPTKLATLTAIRLETIPDARLPAGGAGRFKNGNFHLAEFSAAIQSAQPGANPIRVDFDSAIADFAASALYQPANMLDANPQTVWDTHPHVLDSHWAIFVVKSPMQVDGNSLTITLDAGISNWGEHSLGRFRISATTAPNPLEPNRSGNIADLHIAMAKAQAQMSQFDDALQSFTQALNLAPEREAQVIAAAAPFEGLVDNLLQRRPALATAVGDLSAISKDWQRAIAQYSTSLTPEAKDVNLLVKRAAAYIATEQWDLAKADWRRAIELQPDQLQTAFDTFRNAERWREAAEFGWKLIEQEPGVESWRWMPVAAVVAQAGDKTAYAEFCTRMIQQFADSEAIEDAERTTKVCLLLPATIDLSNLPVEKFTKPLDDATAPDWLLPWGWFARALLAYRSGDAELAVRYVAKSEEFKPSELCHPMNLAVLALAQHQLQHPDAAQTALEEASQLITRLKADTNKKGDHDLLIAEILCREAEALINGKPKSNARE